MQGTRDRVVNAANLSRIRKLKPKIQVAQIDCGHMILKTRPKESALVIAEFARTL
jgi:pimeloyl-ACP methyl ester carboxylesterase